MNRKTACLYCELNSFKYLINKTIGFIRWSLKQVKSPYVACSFGKDSSVMLDLILKIKEDIPIIWITFPETKYLNNYYEVVKEWKNRYRINLHEIFIEIPADQDFDDRKAFPKSGHDSYFIGIRMQESAARRITIRKHGNFHKKKDGIVRIIPLANWKVNDIAAYCLGNDLPILNSYKTEGFSSRTVTGFTEDIYAYRLNQLSELKKRDTNSFNKLILEYPGLRYYV